MWRCCTFCQPEPQSLSWLCTRAEPRCPIPCEWGEASPARLAAEAESLTCYISCVTIAAALALQLHIMPAATGLTACLILCFGRDVPALVPWDRTPPSPSSVCIPLQWWDLEHGSTGDVSLTLSKQRDLQLFLKSCVCLTLSGDFGQG